MPNITTQLRESYVREIQGMTAKLGEVMLRVDGVDKLFIEHAKSINGLAKNTTEEDARIENRVDDHHDRIVRLEGLQKIMEAEVEHIIKRVDTFFKDFNGITTRVRELEEREVLRQVESVADGKPDHHGPLDMDQINAEASKAVDQIIDGTYVPQPSDAEKKVITAHEKLLEIYKDNPGPWATPRSWAGLMKEFIERQPNVEWKKGKKEKKSKKNKK